MCSSRINTASRSRRTELLIVRCRSGPFVLLPVICSAHRDNVQLMTSSLTTASFWSGHHYHRRSRRPLCFIAHPSAQFSLHISTSCEVSAQRRYYMHRIDGHSLVCLSCHTDGRMFAMPLYCLHYVDVIGTMCIFCTDGPQVGGHSRVSPLRTDSLQLFLSVRC